MNLSHAPKTSHAHRDATPEYIWNPRATYNDAIEKNMKHPERAMDTMRQSTLCSPSAGPIRNLTSAEV